jgi:NADPH-dependent curcumin reductase CurA
MEQINMKARIVLCGMISMYNSKEPPRGPALTNVLMKRARVEGFIIIDYFSRFGEFFADMSKWLAEGKIRYDVHVVNGIENALSALNLLFTGGNTGKLLVQVSER